MTKGLVDQPGSNWALGFDYSHSEGMSVTVTGHPTNRIGEVP
jgi:hypothetical protein